MSKARFAHFPHRPALGRSDFSSQPSFDKRQIRGLADLAFVATATNAQLLPDSIRDSELLTDHSGNRTIANLQQDRYLPQTPGRRLARPAPTRDS